mmetsp:Transcript_121515/g.214980  ORF Transcript_121515/g.214980 Transcript_121515/m.214980 type:complete len:111 (-) Transcript_121515:348-680(-)
MAPRPLTEYPPPGGAAGPASGPAPSIEIAPGPTEYPPKLYAPKLDPPSAPPPIMDMAPKPLTWYPPDPEGGAPPPSIDMTPNPGLYPPAPTVLLGDRSTDVGDCGTCVGS